MNSASVTVTGVAMGGVSAWQSSGLADDAKADVGALVEEDISRTAAGVHGVVATQGASTAAKVDSDLAVAQHPAEIGYYGVMTAFAVINDQSVPPQIGTGATIMTKDNIDDPKIAKFVYSD